jgi:hypothetical protein
VNQPVVAPFSKDGCAHECAQAALVASIIILAGEDRRHSL